MTLSVSLTPHLEAFIQQAVSSRRFQSASELVRTALRLLEDREHERLARFQWLRGEIQEGLDSGPATPLDLEEIKRLGRLADGRRKRNVSVVMIRQLPKAQEDLLDIWCPTGYDNPHQADRCLDFLEAKLTLLATTPHMGPLYNDLGPGLRVFPVDNYLIFSRQSVEGIDVVRVLHGARDLESHFRDEHP